MSFTLSTREMIFEQPFLTTFVTTFSLILTLSFYFLSIVLIFVSLPKFLCIIWLSNKLSRKRVVQITLLYQQIQTRCPCLQLDRYNARSELVQKCQPYPVSVVDKSQLGSTQIKVEMLC